MNQRFKVLFGECRDPFPLQESGNIINDNALHVNWEDICSVEVSVEKGEGLVSIQDSENEVLFNFYNYKLKYLIKITIIGINGLIACLIGQSFPSKLSSIFNVVAKLYSVAKIVKTKRAPRTSFGD